MKMSLEGRMIAWIEPMSRYGYILSYCLTIKKNGKIEEEIKLKMNKVQRTAGEGDGELR
jgi:hypothetical protein